MEGSGGKPINGAKLTSTTGIPRRRLPQPPDKNPFSRIALLSLLTPPRNNLRLSRPLSEVYASNTRRRAPILSELSDSTPAADVVLPLNSKVATSTPPFVFERFTPAAANERTCPCPGRCIRMHNAGPQQEYNFNEPRTPPTPRKRRCNRCSVREFTPASSRSGAIRVSGRDLFRGVDRKYL